MGGSNRAARRTGPDHYATTPVGGFPTVKFNDGSATGSVVEAFGFPAAKKYNGDDLIYCRGLAIAGPGTYSDNPALACDQTGGSSGGPWYRDGAGGREAISLNSFGLRGFNGYMFGPVFDQQALAAYNNAAV